MKIELPLSCALALASALLFPGPMTGSAADFVSVPLRAELLLPSPQRLNPKFSGDSFRKQVAQHEARQGDLEPLPVRLILRLTNTGTEPVEIRKGSDASQLELNVKGPGVIDVIPHMAMTREFRMGKPATIAPGESLDLEFPFLGSGLRGMGTWHYWTEPGTIRISGTYTGQLADQKRFQLSAPEVQVEVVRP